MQDFGRNKIRRAQLVQNIRLFLRFRLYLLKLHIFQEIQICSSIKGTCRDVIFGLRRQFMFLFQNKLKKNSGILKGLKRFEVMTENPKKDILFYGCLIFPTCGSSTLFYMSMDVG